MLMQLLDIFSVRQHVIFLHRHNLISKMFSNVCSSVFYYGRTFSFKHWVVSFPVDSGATLVNLYSES